MSINPTMALALAAFAPPGSEVREAAEQERDRIAADLRINELKNSGELRRRDDARALDEQVKWEMS